MPKIIPVLYEISDQTGQVFFADNHDKISDHAFESKMPKKMYTLRAPYIGTAKRELGVPLHKDHYFPELTIAIENCLALGLDPLSREDRIQKEQSIALSLKKYEISYCVIYQLYSNILRNSLPIEKFKDIFLFLEKQGAAWHHIPFPDEESVLEKNRVVFAGLVKSVFGSARASEGLGNVTVGDPPNSKEKTGFGYFKKAVDFFLGIGAHLNGVSLESPEQGSFLHRYLAYENPFSVELIDLLESKRILGKPNTHFNYTQQDGEGKTPLIIAIATRNIKAIYKLLALNQKSGIDIGLNISNQEGQTPLMLACAFGLPIVVQALLRQKANPDLQDAKQRTFSDYLKLVPLEQTKVISMLVHPERGSQVSQSYVFANDTGKSPYCLYEDDEKVVSGDAQRSHFVVLSPLPKHQAQIQKVLEILQNELKIATKQKQGKPKIEEIQGAIEYIIFQNRQAIIPGAKTFLVECQEGQLEVARYLDSVPGKQAIAESKEKALHASSTHLEKKLQVQD